MGESQSSREGYTKADGDNTDDQADAQEAPSPGPGDAGQPEQRGGMLFGQKLYAEAEAVYREAIDADPGSARHHNDFATTLFAQGRYAAAETAELEALRLDPDNAQYHDNLGEYLLAQKRYVNAETAYRNAVRLDPGNAGYLNDLGRSLFPQERYADAEDVQRKAIAIGYAVSDTAIGRKLYSQFHNNLGDALFSQGCYAEAEDAYREACRLDPDSARNHNDFGATLFSRRKYDEAEAEHRAAVDLEPGSALFQNNLGDTLFALERYREAEDACRKAVDLAEDEGVYHHDLGTALFMQKRYPDATREYQRAIQLDDADARYQNSMSLCLLAQQRYEDAEAAGREALRLDSGNAEYRENLANILVAHARHAVAQQQSAEAEDALREAVRLSPGNAEYHNDLGIVLFASQRYDEAEAEQREAVDLDPAKASYLTNLGATLFAHARYLGPGGAADGIAADNSPDAVAAGLFGQAKDAVTAAIRLDPSNAGYHNSLSAILFSQERYAEAEDALREAIRLDSGNDTNRSNLGHVLFAQQRYREAEDAYRQALRLCAASSKHHDDLGTALFAQRRFALAETEYRNSVRLAQATAPAEYHPAHLAAALSAQGKYPDAVSVFKSAIERDPANADYHDKLAIALYHLRSYREAECEERAAIRMATSPAEAAAFRINLARILLHQARLPEAEQELSALDDSEAADATVYGLLGIVMERQGQLANAEANYRRSLSIESNVSFRCNLGILLAGSHRFNDAAEETYQALEDAPTSWMPHYALGLLALEQADEYHDNSYYDDAVQHFKRAMDMLIAHTSPSAQTAIRAILHLNLGYAHGKLGQTSRALTEFRSSKRVSRTHSRTWFTADANIRRYRRRESTATSQRTQAAVFMVLGISVITAIALLEWKGKLTSPYLVSLLAVVVILFVIAFYLPIVTSIKLGPVSLDKQATGLRSDPPEPIPSGRDSPDTNLEQWADSEPPEAMGRNQESLTLPAPAATGPKPTPQETPPIPRPFGVRLFGASA